MTGGFVFAVALAVALGGGGGESLATADGGAIGGIALSVGAVDATGRAISGSFAVGRTCGVQDETAVERAPNSALTRS